MPKKPVIANVRPNGVTKMFKCEGVGRDFHYTTIHIPDNLEASGLLPEDLDGKLFCEECTNAQTFEQRSARMQANRKASAAGVGEDEGE